jgi:hypothetical protein
MADPIARAGRLIAVDGTRGKDTAAAADAIAGELADRGIECAISRFDASGLFGELAAAHDDRQISVRTLTLIYAADLAFRLRWEIQPVLTSGRVVIAAPYVDTAVAFGVGCGLREQWTADLLRFAPRPEIRGRAVERKHRKGWKARLDRGYAEFCAALLDGSAPALANASARRDAIACLERRHRSAYPLSEKGLRRLADDVMDSSKAAARGSRGRSRSGRT